MRSTSLLGLAAAAALSLISSAFAQPSEALVFDSRGRDLYRVNTLTGDRTLVSGSRWDRPDGLLWEAAGTALVLDSQAGMLDRVDPASAQTIAGNSVGSGPDLAGLDFLTALSVSACLGANARGDLIEIHLATGNRRVASGSGVGLAPPAPMITAIAAEDATHVIVAHVAYQRNPAGPWPDGLYRVDLSTGHWTPVALADPISDEVDAVNFHQPREILPADDGGFVLLESIPPALTFVDAAGNFLVNIALIREAEGPPLVFPVAAAEQRDGSLLVLDRELSGLYRVALPAGTRTVVSRAGERGAGPDLDHPMDMALDADCETALVLSGRASQSLIEVDLLTGDRTVVFDSRVGQGPLMETPVRHGIRLRGGDILAAVNGGFELMRIDPATGDRATVMAFQESVQCLAPGLGKTVWVGRGEWLQEADLDAQTVTTIFEIPASGTTNPRINAIRPLGPHRILLLLDKSIRELDLLTDPPTLTTAFSDPLTHRDYLYQWLDLLDLDEDTFIFTDHGRNQNFASNRPGLYRAARGSLESATAISDQETGGGAPMPDPRQFAVDETSTIYVVNAANPPALLRVNTLNGARTEISGPGRGVGPLWQTATSLWLVDGVPEPQTLDQVLNHVLGIEVLAGDALRAVDADDSGTIDAADVVLVLGP